MDHHINSVNFSVIDADMVDRGDRAIAEEDKVSRLHRVIIHADTVLCLPCGIVRQIDTNELIALHDKSRAVAVSESGLSPCVDTADVLISAVNNDLSLSLCVRALRR